MNDTSDRPARFLWLPPAARPPITLPRRQELVFLLVGLTLLFSGYDLNVFGLALPQIQASLHIPEDMAGATVSFFRLAAIPALAMALSADVFGRRRLLLVTVFGEALLTVATAFAPNYGAFVGLQVGARVFGYAEELLCFVVIVEEIETGVRGWASGTLGALNAFGAGLAAIAFAAINVLPHGWRALYVIGGGTLFILAYYRRWLPETTRFEVRRQELARLGSKTSAALDALSRLVREHPGRLALLVLGVGGFGYAEGPATVLMAKYLQQTHHYAPAQVTLLYVPGGLVALAGNILAGRISDRIGRRRVLMACATVSGLAFAVFYSGLGGWVLPPMWVVAIFGYLAADALLAALAVEIFPTAYRATVSGIRYFTVILSGAIGLALEGVLYDRFGGHGPAIAVSLLAMPLALIGIFFLPEPAGKVLEEISDGPEDGGGLHPML